MKMGVFCRRSYGDSFEPVTLIEAYQAWLAQSGHQFCKPGDAPYEDELRRFRLRSPANAHCVVQDAMRTKTLILEPRTCAASPISKDGN